MKMKDVQEFFDKVTYKPDKRIQMYIQGDQDTFFLKIHGLEPNSDNAKEQVNLCRGQVIAFEGWVGSSQERKLEIVRECILEYETHELDEWLRFDGKRIREPHE